MNNGWSDCAETSRNLNSLLYQGIWQAFDSKTCHLKVLLFSKMHTVQFLTAHSVPFTVSTLLSSHTAEKKVARLCIKTNWSC